MRSDPVPVLRISADPRGWSRPARNIRAHALYTDGSWRTCHILGWLGSGSRWFVHIRWPDGEADWRRYDPRYLHPA